MFKKLAAIISTVLALCAPASATQNSYVMPLSGPLSMSAVMTLLNAGLLSMNQCHSGTTAPANGPSAAPSTFQCWMDTTTSPIVAKVYDGTSWVVIAKLNNSTHTWTPSFQGTDTGNASTGTTGASGHTIPFLDIANTWSAAQTFTTPPIVQSSSAIAFSVGSSGATNPAFSVGSGASFATGVQIISQVAGSGSGIIATSSGTNEAISINAKGSGTILIANASTGAITLGRATTISGALTYGGVTLNNTMTGTGNMVASSGPTLTNPLISGASPASTGALGFTSGLLNWFDGTVIKTAVTLDNSQTLTNKTFNCANNTCTVRLGSDVTGQLPLANIVTGTQDTALGYFGSTSVSALAIGNCSNALTYSTTTHTFGCNSTAGTGTVTSAQISAGNGIAVATTSGANPCVSACNLTVSLTTARQTLPTVQRFTTSGSATYTTPANVLYIRVTYCGAGGGGGGAGTVGSPTAGGASAFDTGGTNLSAPGGSAGGSALGGAGGTIPTGSFGVLLGAWPGGSGGDFAQSGASSFEGGIGGMSALWGGGGQIHPLTPFNGSAGVALTSGGGGGGSTSASGSGGGGGAGACVVALKTSPASTYGYTVGAAGVGGVGSFSTGGAGGSAQLVVEEFYN